jgi:hypothetical protein
VELTAEAKRGATASGPVRRCRRLARTCTWWFAKNGHTVTHAVLRLSELVSGPSCHFDSRRRRL